MSTPSISKRVGRAPTKGRASGRRSTKPFPGRGAGGATKQPWSPPDSSAPSKSVQGRQNLLTNAPLHLLMRRGVRLQRRGVRLVRRIVMSHEFEGHPRRLSLGKVSIVRFSGGGHLIVGNDVRIEDGVRIYLHGPDSTVILEDGVLLNYNSAIYCENTVTVKARSGLSFNSTIIDSDFHHVSGQRPETSVVIEPDILLGTGATVLKGVNVGAGAVVAAGTVVTKDVAPRSLVAGVPARVIREDVDFVF